MPRESAGVPASAVGPSGFGPAGLPMRSSTPGAAVPSRGSRFGGGGELRSWPGARRRFGGSAGLRASVPFGEERRSLPARERRSDPGRRSSLGSFRGANRSRVPPKPRLGACGRCGEASLPARVRCGRRKVRMLVCPAPRAETRFLDLRDRRSERGWCRIVRFDAAARGTGDSLPRIFARSSRPRLMRRRVAPVLGTAQRASSPCPRRLILYHARHRLAHPRAPRRRHATHGFRRRRRAPGDRWHYRRGMSTV